MSEPIQKLFYPEAERLFDERVPALSASASRYKSSCLIYPGPRVSAGDRSIKVCRVKYFGKTTHFTTSVTRCMPHDSLERFRKKAQAMVFLTRDTISI